MNKNINRFNFSKPFIDKIKLFCENYKSIDNNDFKKKYQLWKFENNKIINNEKNLLISNGYQGNFENKLNKSILYYFKYNFAINIDYVNKNKEVIQNNNTIKRQYLTFDFEFLQLIDAHITRHFKSEYKIKTKLLFDNFKLLYNNEILNEKNKLKNFLNDENAIDNKIKKAYQNRYFNINKSLIK